MGPPLADADCNCTYALLLWDSLGRAVVVVIRIIYFPAVSYVSSQHSLFLDHV